VVGEERMPVLTVTSSHRVSVLVESTAPKHKKSGDIADKDDSIQNCFEESSFLQFASRPGKATAFLPDTEDNGKQPKSGGSAIRVPAVFDAQQDRVYALQKHNTKLISYAATGASGAENEASSSIAVDLELPALSLSLLHLPRASSKSSPRCLAYGTCQDGRIFVASLTCDRDPTMLVEYFDTETQSFSKDHVGTLAHMVANDTPPTFSPSKRKRKVEPATYSGECDVVIYQLFRQTHGVLLVRQMIQVAPHVTKGNSWVAATVTAFRKGPKNVLVRLMKEETTQSSILNVSLLGLVEGNDAITVFFTDTTEQTFYTLISLRTGETMGAPILLPQNARQAGLLGPALLAVLTERSGMFRFEFHD